MIKVMTSRLTIDSAYKQHIVSLENWHQSGEHLGETKPFLLCC